MRFSRFLVVPVLTLFAAVLGPGILRAEEFEHVSITEIPLAKVQAEPTVHGYVEYRFRVTNRDAQRAHRVTLTLPRAGHTGLKQISNQIEVQPGKTVVLSLLQPPVPISGGDLSVGVQVDGRWQQKGLPCNILLQHCMERYGSTGTGAHILTGVQVIPDIRDLITRGPTPPGGTSISGGASAAPGMSASPYGGSSGPKQISVWEAESPVGEWSSHWLAYTRFDGIALTSGELRDLQQRHGEIFAAVRRYIESGGILLVIGSDWAPPKEWVLREKTSRDDEKIYDAVLGTAYVFSNDVPKLRSNIGPFRNTMFSRADMWSHAMSGGHGGSSYGPGILGGNSDLIDNLEVLKNFGVPVRTILVLILVFAVLIGPVNIFVLTMLKRRIWLLWTVPATSIIASLFVYGADYLREGFLKQSASRSVTVLDQRRQEAFTFGFVGFYSTFTPSDGLTFDPVSEASCAYERGSHSGSNRVFEMRLEAGGSQKFSSGWVRARLPSYFAVRKAESRKERLDFNWEPEGGGEPTVSNALGVDLARLVVNAPDGKRYTATNIKAGDRVKLSPDLSPTPASMTGPPPTADATAFYASLSGTYLNPRSWITYRMDTSLATLPPGYYAAEVGGSGENPFLEKPLDRAASFNHACVIYGVF